MDSESVGSNSIMTSENYSRTSSYNHGYVVLNESIATHEDSWLSNSINTNFMSIQSYQSKLSIASASSFKSINVLSRSQDNSFMLPSSRESSKHQLSDGK